MGVQDGVGDLVAHFVCNKGRILCVLREEVYKFNGINHYVLILRKKDYMHLIPLFGLQQNFFRDMKATLAHVATMQLLI